MNNVNSDFYRLTPKDAAIFARVFANKPGAPRLVKTWRKIDFSVPSRDEISSLRIRFAWEGEKAEIAAWRKHFLQLFEKEDANPAGSWQDRDLSGAYAFDSLRILDLARYGEVFPGRRFLGEEVCGDILLLRPPHPDDLAGVGDEFVEVD